MTESVAESDDLDAIDAFFRTAPGVHLYGIGDLDEPYRSHTRFFVQSDGGIENVAVLYSGGRPRTLLALTAGDSNKMVALVRGIAGELDRETYLHASPGVDEGLRAIADLESFGTHWKMLLDEPARSVDAAPIEFGRLGREHMDEIEALYAEAYPANFFDPRSLDSGFVVGARDAEGMTAIAGLHTLSLVRRVAALGNVATHPRARGRGIARALTAALVRLLLPNVDHIGLNVGDDNEAAIRAYRAIGFSTVARYSESLMRLRSR